MMLLPVVVMPVLFRMLGDVPAASSVAAVGTSAAATMLVVIGVTILGTSALRLWSPVLGIVAGTVVAMLFGLYDAERVLAAPWIGVPAPRWPGLDLSFGPAFWAHLPVFLILALVLTAKAVAGAAGTQRVSHPDARAVDYRAVQRASGAEGVGNLLAGLAGTVPNTTYLVSISVIELTGVAVRAVATVAGAAFIALAFLPKALAVVLAIPAPVIAASVMMTMALLFVNGLREVVASGLDVRKGLIVGVSFWAGVAFENDWVFPEHFTDFAGGILASGMSAGCLAAMALTLLVEAAKPRRRRLRCRFDIGELPRINDFLADFANRSHWPSAMAARLQAAAEEALLTLGRHGEAQGAATEGRGLVLTAHREGGGAVLEVVASTEADNLQDRIAVLGEEPVGISSAHEASLRLLRSMASDVRHQQYYGADIVSMRIDLPTAGG